MGFISWLEGIFGNGYIVTFIISMLPVFELRGAIPVGVSLGLSVHKTVLTAVIGNIVPVPFILLFIRRIFAWMRRRLPKLEKFVSSLEKRAEAKKEIVLKWEFWGLVALVAIPLPGTGAWTGALVAAIMRLRLKRAVPAIFIGILIAAVIVVGVTYGVAAII